MRPDPAPRPGVAPFPHAAIAVVIPAFQAEASIERVVRAFAARADWVIVVDDASSDATAERVAALALGNVELIRHTANCGVGGAMKTGISAALACGADVVVKVDADDQMDPEALDVLLQPLLDDEADVAKGNRWHDRSELRAMPRLRRMGNVALSFLTRLASGHWHVFDPNNGYVAWRADLLRLIDGADVPDRYTFEAGMLVETGALRALVRDVPIPARYGDETSHLRVRRVAADFLGFLLYATVRRVWRTYFVDDFTPVSLLIVGGTALTGFGTLFGGLHWASSIATGVPATAGTVLLAALPFLLGCNLLLQAFVLDVQSTPRKKRCADLGVKPDERRRADAPR